MDLKEFIAETLSQITEGIREAQERTKGTGARVSPTLNGSSEHAVKLGFLSAYGGAAQVVKFDVALTVKDTADKKGGIGIFAGAISIGATAQSGLENASISRVQFCIPMGFPEHH